jgi:hypothetical protein
MPPAGSRRFDLPEDGAPSAAPGTAPIEAGLEAVQLGLF